MSLGFLGCGQMACALARGFVAASICKPEEIILSDAVPQALERVKTAGFRTTMDNNEVVRQSEVIILAVKPLDAISVLSLIAEAMRQNKLLISICAGITMSQIKEYLCNNSLRLFRVMPNACCLVGASASCISHENASVNDVEFVKKLFEAVGRCYEVEEYYLDVVTALSGSGPAFIFTLIDAMSDAGVKGGLSRDVATGLAAQTVLGAGKMVLETGKHPAELKDQVTSPGGTTSAGITELEKTGFRFSIMSAVDAARERAANIGKS